MSASASDNADFLRLSSGPITNGTNGFFGDVNSEFDHDDEDDGPPALQMSNEELAALQSRFRLECDMNSDSEESDEECQRTRPIDKPTIVVSANGNAGMSITPSQGSANWRPHDESACFPTDSMILENKTIYENMLQEDPNNLTAVDSWQAVNKPKYVSRPDGWTFARPNDLVQLTPEEYLALRSEPIGALGENKNLSAFEMAGLLPSTSPASSTSPVMAEDSRESPFPQTNKLVSEANPSDLSVNIDYLLQPTLPAVSENTLDLSAMNTSPVPTTTASTQQQPQANLTKADNRDDVRVAQPDSGRDTDRQSPSSESHSYRSTSGSGSVSFSFNNGSVIADATDPDLAAVDAMLEMYDADVDPDELAEHIMMRFGVNPQRPGSSSGIFREQADESLLRPPNRSGGLSLASVVSSTPKAAPGLKNGSRPGSAQSSASRKVDTTASSQVTIENVTAGRISSESLARVPSSLNNDKRISTQSAPSPRDSTSTVTNGGFVKPAKPTGIENIERNTKVSPNFQPLSQSNLSLVSSFDSSSISDYGPLLTPVADKGPFIRLEWDKLAIDLTEPVFAGQSHDLMLTAKNIGRLWVQLSATLQQLKVDGNQLPGPKGLHILNSTVVIEPNSSGTFRLRFAPSEPGFYSANVDLFACVVGSVVEESRNLPPIPFSADVRLPNVVFQTPSQNICDFGAVPAGASKRVVCSLRFQPPGALNPASSSYNNDVPIVVTIRPESAWRCFHFLPSAGASVDSLMASKSISAAPMPLYGAGHATKLHLSPIHQQHEFMVCFTARYDTDISPNHQGLDLNEAELVAQTDSTPPRQLAVVPLRAGVGIISLKAVGLDQNADDSTTLRMSCQASTSIIRSFFLVNTGSIAIDVDTNITASPATQNNDQANSASIKMFTVQPNQFTLLPKQKVQLAVKFDPVGLNPGEMCAGFLSFFTDPPQSGSPGQLPALDVSLIGLTTSAENVVESNRLSHHRSATSSQPGSVHSTPGSVSQLMPFDNSRPNSLQRPTAMSIGSASSDSANSSASSASGSRRSLVTSHQRVVWWGVEAGQCIEQVVNLRNVGSDEVSVRISIRDNSSDPQQLAFVLGGSSSFAAPLLATLPPASDFPMRIIFRAQSQHQLRAAIAKMQIKVLASGAGSVPPGLKFCIPLFGAVGTTSMNAEGSSLKTTSAGHYYSIIGTVPVGARRTMRLTLRNTGPRNAFFSAIPFADMSCTQRLTATKLVCTPAQACIAPNECLDLTVDLFVGDREAALCAERSYIVACLQIVFGDNDLRVMAGRALSCVKPNELRRLLDETALELIRGSANSIDELPRTLTGNLAQTEAWPEHLRLFSRHYRRLYVALVGERTSAGPSNGGADFDEETLQHTMLLDDTQATIMFPPSIMNHERQAGTIASLVELRSSGSSNRQPASVAPTLPTVIDSPRSSVGGIRLLPSELLLTAVSDSRTLMLINDTSSTTDFESEWPAHILHVEPPKGVLAPNGTATILVRLAAGAAAFVDSQQQQWVGRIAVRTSLGHRLESVVRVHLSSLQTPSSFASSSMPPPATVPNSAQRIRQMQANRAEPVVQIVFGSRDMPHPPAARLDFGKIQLSTDQMQQRKLGLRLENEQPFAVNWQLEELSAYALASLPGQTPGAQIPTSSGTSSRCVPSIFSFAPTKQGNLPANGGQVLLKCVFQPPSTPNKQLQQDTNYLQHFLLTLKGATGWTAETRLSVIASVVTNASSSGGSATNPNTPSHHSANINIANSSMNLGDQSQISRISNSSTCSAAPLSASKRGDSARRSTSRFLVCPGEKHEFKKVVRPGESVKEKVNLENRNPSQPLHVEIVNGPSLPFSTKHRRFTIEPMHYLHLPIVFKPVAPGSFRSEITLHATTSPSNGIPDEVLTVSLLAQAGL